MQDGTDYVIPRIKALDLYAEWESEFKPLLGHTARWEAFSYIVRDQLVERARPIIIETGTLRKLGNWEGDGCSTVVWNWILERRDGHGTSIDLNLDAVKLARENCPKMTVVWADSVLTLRGIESDVMKGFYPPPTLLYLDSCDYPESLVARLNSMVHQVAELTSIWNKLPSGCLIVSDDSFGPNDGKPAFTRRIMAAMGIYPEIDGYVVVWRKP